MIPRENHDDHPRASPRVRLLVPLAIIPLLLMALPATTAHAPTNCHPPSAFPSSAGWILQPGETLSYSIPANQFGSVANLAPLDITLYPALSCEPDPNCHHHGATGYTICGTYQHATMEIHNPGPGDALVLLAIGQCGWGLGNC